jgi:hypothetical protein
MKEKILILVLIIFGGMLIFSGCINTGYKATVKLVNNYSDTVTLLFSEDLEYVMESGGEYTVDETKGVPVISTLHSGESISEYIKLTHDIYGIYDWAVFYVAERDEDDQILDWEPASLSEINDDYKFEFLRTYTITLDESLNLTIDVEQPEE